MSIKQFIERWCARHETGPNRILHTIGIPATVVGVVVAFFGMWLLAVACFVGGYVLQTLGHYLEGSRVGEVLLIKKIVFPKGGFVRRFLIICVVLAVLVFGALAAQGLVNRYVLHNFSQAVGPGMYRSGNLPAEKLAKIIDRYEIKTVVNLRGKDDKPWYAAEREAVATSEAKLIDFGLTASNYPSPAQLRKLLDLVESIEPPFLVHCHGGSDRTGMYFVLLALREGKSWDEAMKQLSIWRFTHCSKVKSAAITYPLYNFSEYAESEGLP